jgi:hypothetical protein
MNDANKKLLVKTMTNSFLEKGCSFKKGAWFTWTRRLEPVHQRKLWMASSLGTKQWPRMSDCQALRQLVVLLVKKSSTNMKQKSHHGKKVSRVPRDPSSHPFFNL